jgi:hypothetical protein
VIPVAVERPQVVEALAPFGRAFPGLAPGTRGDGDLDGAARVASELKGRLGLVAVTRPGDAVMAAVCVALQGLRDKNGTMNFDELDARMRLFETMNERAPVHLLLAG